uniref:G protein subunit alpha 12a n=1 Tax=Terebratalia transversa TaxID=34513 RepID=M9V136_TERTR|nr:G protein subunit alpha 12a [Terebratalia transversa]
MTEKAAGKEITKSATARSRHIDHQIDHDRDEKHREVQLLILGGGGSGKSTFIKQLRIHHGDGYPVEERKRMKYDVYENAIDAFHRVVKNMKELSITLEIVDNSKKYETLCETYPMQEILCVFPNVENGNSALRSPQLSRSRPQPSEIPAQLLSIWEDAGFQRAFNLREKFCDPLTEAEIYFLEHFIRVSNKHYIPTVQDLLHVRKPTVGVQEHSFRVQEFLFRVIDVAGQKSQRKKWMHFFDGVTAVIFFVALSGFNEQLEEDSTMNKLHDSLEIFEEVTRNKFLLIADFILFLNKQDLFLQKLENGLSIRTAFPEFKEKSGAVNPDASIKYIRNKFFATAPQNKMIYPHVSCAIDIDLMKVIIDDVLQIIMEINLKKAALI